MNMKSMCLSGLLLLLIPVISAGENQGLMLALESIQKDDLQKHLDLLANDSLEGREAGTRGGRAAGSYITKQLKAAGLTPAGEDASYYQPFGRGYRNILAVLPGSHEQLSKEVILIGGHYDHVGYGSYLNSRGKIGAIHNGADDNASGISAMLELIQAWDVSGLRPERTILFAFWDGEEKGLLGSKYWIKQPTVKFSQIKLAINIDMIGRLRMRSSPSLVCEPPKT